MYDLHFRRRPRETDHVCRSPFGRHVTGVGDGGRLGRRAIERPDRDEPGDRHAGVSKNVRRSCSSPRGPTDLRGGVHPDEPAGRDVGARRTQPGEVRGYCNNNFLDAEGPFPAKLASASLNLSTFIALYSLRISQRLRAGTVDRYGRDETRFRVLGRSGASLALQDIPAQDSHRGCLPDPWYWWGAGAIRPVIVVMPECLL